MGSGMIPPSNDGAAGMTDVKNELVELIDADLERVVAGALNAAVSTGGGVHPDKVGNQSHGPGAGKPTFNVFQIIRPIDHG
jgi:hypothetical protein